LDATHLFNGTHDLFATGGTEGHLLWVSGGWEDVLGWTPEEMTSTPFLDLIHPDDHTATFTAYHQLVHHGGEVLLFRNRYRTKGGGWRRLEWNAAVLPDGTLYGVARDLTRLASAASVPQVSDDALLHLTGAGGWALDLESDTLTASPRARELLDLPHASTATTTTVFRRLRAAERAALRQAIRDAYQQGDTFDIVAPLIEGDRHVRLRGQATTDPSRRFTGVLGVVTDVTDDIRHSQTLRSTQDALERAQRARQSSGLRLDSVAHDLRNHASAVYGVAGILQSADPTLVRALKAAAGDVLRLVDELVGRSSARVLHAEVDPVHIVDDVLAMVQPQVQLLDLRRHLHPGVPERVYTDAGRLRQILTNLVLNSLKFTEDGEVRVEVQAETGDTDHSDTWLRFDVIDTGPGIDPALLQRVTQPYVGASGAQRGSGLGLNIVRSLLAELDGTFELLSSSSGTHATVRVPLCIPAIVADQAHGQKSRRVLLVDDHPINARVACALLSQQGCDVTVAASVEAAKPLMEVSTWDLILLDLHLPDGNGADLCSWFRALETQQGLPRTPVIGTSAEPSEVWRDVDIDDDLPKPLSPHHMSQILAQHIGPRS
jgi:PAS domain S-box-containing protein